MNNPSAATAFSRGGPRPWIGFCLLASSLTLAAEIKLPPPTTGRVIDYLQEVKPLLAKNCYECHGDEKQQAGLRLDLRQNALRGGDYGPVIIPGDSAKSKLIHKLVDGDGGDVMPVDGELTPAEIGLLRAWIDQGAEFRNDVGAEPPPKPIEPKLAALIAAVRAEPRPAAERLLKANPELLNAKDPAGSTPLHHAVGFGKLETMQMLVDAGADLKAINRRGSTPLHWAVTDAAKVSLLLKHGAAINTKQSDGRTPLYLAALLGNGHSILSLLLEHGADPNLKSANGRTPLMVAAMRGDDEAVRRLLAAKAAVNAADSSGETALMLAATKGSADTVRVLLEAGADARLKTKRNETALGNAGTAGDESVVRQLLDHGAEVNVRNIRGFSPLMLAASSDTLPAAAVKLLLAKGADPTCTGDYDETAADLAAKRGPSEVVRLLGAAASASSPAAGRSAGEKQVRSIPDAVERALVMTEKQSYTFIRTAGCNSCHSQDLPSAAAAFARGRGLKAPREIPQLPDTGGLAAERVMTLDFVTVSSKGWEILDLGMNGVPKNAYTDSVARLMKALQSPDGHWFATEGRRPPMGAGEIQATALAIYTLKTYPPSGDEAACNDSIARAAAWLQTAKPQATQDRAFHLLGLAWGGATPDAESVRALAAMQRADGGWSQLPHMESDAYATGEVMFALSTAGSMSATNPVYRKGVDYLLATQADDGTWQVKTRAIWLQPYFESGFPYGKDQFISTAGTAWAAMALAAAQPPAIAAATPKGTD